MTTFRSRRAELRLEIIDDKEDMRDIPSLFQSWGMHIEPQECIWVVAYDADLSVRTVIEIARGSHTRAEYHLPSLFGAILTAGAERFVVVHNHPNKRVQPSKGDRKMTIDIMNAANVMGLYFEDHIILSPTGNWFSFHDVGLLKRPDYIKHASSAAA